MADEKRLGDCIVFASEGLLGSVAADSLQDHFGIKEDQLKNKLSLFNNASRQNFPLDEVSVKLDVEKQILRIVGSVQEIVMNVGFSSLFCTKNDDIHVLKKIDMVLHYCERPVLGLKLVKIGLKSTSQGPDRVSLKFKVTESTI